MNGSILRRFFGIALFVAAIGYAFGVGLTGTPSLSVPAHAQTEGNVPGNAQGHVSDSDFWRQVRDGKSFTLTNPSLGSAVLIQAKGEVWRNIHNGPISVYGGYILAAAVAGVLIFFLIRGRVKAEHNTGRMVLRFNMLERMSHWAVAILFVILGLTGLTILYGKYVVVPLLGKDAFAAIASGALQAHNLLGPLFALAIVVMVLVFVKDNIAHVRDIPWLMKGGFMFRHQVPSGKFNFGEKIWFWLVAFGGLAIAGSGLFLDLPGILEGTRDTQQWANIIHAVGALVLMAAAIGHIYLGTVGVDGALDGMMTGEVDEGWAREHHAFWADDMLGEEEPAKSASPAE